MMFKIGIQLCAKRLLSRPSTTVIPKVVKLENVLPQKTQLVRNTSFFNRTTAEELWKGVTTVSNAGKKRGRGKGTDRKLRKNLNMGQRVGIGKERVLWPGLTCPVIQSKTLVKIQELPKDSLQQPEVANAYPKRVFKVHPMERGWTSKSAAGKKYGPPDPRGDETYEAFESVVLNLELYQTMTSLLGTKKGFKTIVVVGNRNGLIGYARAKGLDRFAVIRRAKNLAIRRLINVDLLDKHTVNHDFFSHFGSSRLLVMKKPRGYGLKCHRALRECCQLIGIEDLWVKAEGPRNLLHILRAFFLGLLRQKTYQQMADEKKLHLVEFREECGNFPKVLASPQQCLTEAEAKKDPVEFDQYILGDRVLWPKRKKGPSYENLPSWTTHLKRTLYKRNHDKVKRDLMARYGKCSSHLTAAYPECVEPITRLKTDHENAL